MVNIAKYSTGNIFETTTTQRYNAKNTGAFFRHVNWVKIVLKKLRIKAHFFETNRLKKTFCGICKPANCHFLPHTFMFNAWLEFTMISLKNHCFACLTAWLRAVECVISNEYRYLLVSPWNIFFTYCINTINISLIHHSISFTYCKYTISYYSHTHTSTLCSNVITWHNHKHITPYIYIHCCMILLSDCQMFSLILHRLVLFGFYVACLFSTHRCSC